MKFFIYGILAVVLVLGALRLLSRKLLYFPLPIDKSRRRTLESLPPAVRPLTVNAFDGTKLAGWCIEKDPEHLPFIFYFGGNAEEVSLNLEDFLAKVPANGVLFNYRGFGDSGGRPTEDHLKSDSLALFDAVAKQYGLDPSACLAWGRSIGSSMAAYLAKERNLGGLILTCPFDSIEAVAAGIYPARLIRLVLTDRHRTVDFAPAITCPVLILAAQADEIIPFERTKALADSMTCPVQFEVIEGAGHNTISEVSGYYEAVQAFITRAGLRQ